MDPNRDEPVQDDEPAAEHDGPAVVPAISSEQVAIAAGVGVGAYANRAENVDGDNDQDQHVSPPDNDGETVPADEVEDQVGG